MTSYKLNNSNTIYVNWHYINKVRRLSMKYSSQSVQPSVTRNKIESSNTHKQVSHLPKGTRFNSNFFGEGVLTSTNGNGIITVLFGKNTVRFAYPDAIQQGFLQRV